MQRINKRVLVFLIFSFSVYGFAQHSITGKVVDTNLTPIAFTKITNINNNETITSHWDGSFKLIKKGVYLFKKDGYFEKTVQLTDNQHYIISLDINPSELNEIVINASHIPKKLKKTSMAISIISKDDIEKYNNTDFAPILNRIPGVFMQSGALNTNRITIRGIGSRTPFGTSKIRAYFKDIPLTNGSGETTIEDFELASISRMEILKGSASSIYGSGLGGVIHLMPINPYLNKSSFNSEFSMGSFGLIKNSFNANYGTTKNSFRTVYSNTKSNGYRENNNYNKQTFTVTSNHFLNKRDDLTFFGSYINLKAFIPSSVDEDTFLNNPKLAAFSWKQAQGFEDFNRGVFGLSWNHEYKNNLKHITSIFTSFKQNYEPRPFNILEENTAAIGIRTRIIGNSKLFNKNTEWTLGCELFRDNNNYKTLENLYENFPLGTGSVKGNELSNFKEKRNYYNIFTEINYNLSQKTTLSIGLNLNRTAYKLEDNFPVSEVNPSQSGSFKFKTIASPKLGVSYSVSKNINLFSNISHGFSPISLQETLLPDGQINTNLKPETGWNFEIGTRGSILNNRLQFNASVYQLDMRNLLVSKRVSNDQFIGLNAGKTQHNGLEFDAHFSWLSKESITINSFVSYTLNNFTFKRFFDGLNNYSGNDLTGVPSNVLNIGIDFNTRFHFYGTINYQYVGSMPITDSNDIFSNSYNLTNLKIGYKTTLNKKLNLNAFLGINNIFDKHYASQILINASGFGANAPRYYYPGNPINYYTGINFSYTF